MTQVRPSPPWLSIPSLTGICRPSAREATCPFGREGREGAGSAFTSWNLEPALLNRTFP